VRAVTLARVNGTSAAKHWLYAHVEVQTQREDDLARRMFTHNHRLMERWGRTVTGSAVLADDSRTGRPGECRF